VLPRTAVAAGETSFYDFTVQYKGAPFALSAFKDKVTVVVNVASE
jgi:glutathione peroxidase-family protein